MHDLLRQLYSDCYEIEKDLAKSSRRTLRVSQVCLVGLTLFYGVFAGLELAKDEPSLWMVALLAFSWVFVTACWVPILLLSHLSLKEAKASMDRLLSLLAEHE